MICPRCRTLEKRPGWAYCQPCKRDYARMQRKRPNVAAAKRAAEKRRRRQKQLREQIAQLPAVPLRVRVELEALAREWGLVR